MRVPLINTIKDKSVLTVINNNIKYDRELVERFLKENSPVYETDIDKYSYYARGLVSGMWFSGKLTCREKRIAWDYIDTQYESMKSLLY